MSLLALQTSYIARIATRQHIRQTALFTGAFALGSGIWATHFIGMLAFVLPEQVSYDIGITLLSILPAFVSSWLVLNHLSRTSPSFHTIIFSGTLVGGGIGLMHYIGMVAMETSLHMHHHTDLTVLALIIGVVLACLALWMRRGLHAFGISSVQRFYLASTVMGMAIVGMHYTAMYGTSFYGHTTTPLPDKLASETIYFAFALSSIAITVGITVVALNSLVNSRELHRVAQSSQSRLSAIVNTAVDAIITIDGLGSIREFNKSAELLFGYQASEVLGQNVKILMPEPYSSQHDGYLLRHQSTGEKRLIGKAREVSGKRKDGSIFPIRLSVGKVELDNRELMFVGLISDISQRVALEDSLRDTAARAEQAAEAKGRFLANMSHEIRTPMNAIIGFTELLLETNINDNQRSHLQTIRHSSSLLLEIINNILDTSKLDADKVEVEKHNFCLKSMATQLEASLGLTAKSKGIAFITHYPEDLPSNFIGDRLRMMQVLNNLAGNAVKFTERGQVEVFYSYHDGTVQIRIKDTGIGMNQEQLQNIFEPFNQADASISRRFGGTGLGTTIAKQLVEAMGGTITVNSQCNLGSEFIVSVPMQLGEQNQEQPQQLTETTEPITSCDANIEVLQATASELLNYLTSHEINEQLLETLYEELQKGCSNKQDLKLQLNMAVNEFDFSKAAEILKQLLAEIATEQHQE